MWQISLYKSAQFTPQAGLSPVTGQLLHRLGHTFSSVQVIDLTSSFSPPSFLLNLSFKLDHLNGPFIFPFSFLLLLNLFIQEALGFFFSPSYKLSTLSYSHQPCAQKFPFPTMSVLYFCTCCSQAAYLISGCIRLNWKVLAPLQGPGRISQDWQSTEGDSGFVEVLEGSGAVCG